MYPYIYLGDFRLPMYGVMISTGVIISVILGIYDCKKRGLLWEYMLAMVAPGLLFGLLGAKLLFFAVTYSLSEVLEIFKSGDFERIVSGGYVFYGGLTIGILTAIFMAKITKCKFSDYENVLVKCVPLAYAFGRIGCFLAGCCYGIPTNSFLGISYVYPLGSAPLGVPLIPIQLFESLFSLLLTAFLWILDKKKDGNVNLVSVYLIFYSIGRFVFEFFRYDSERGFWLGISTSQWISAAFFVAGVLYLIYKKKKTVKF